MEVAQIGRSRLSKSPMNVAVRNIAGGIGLVSESIKVRKEKKRMKKEGGACYSDEYAGTVERVQVSIKDVEKMNFSIHGVAAGVPTAPLSSDIDRPSQGIVVEDEWELDEALQELSSSRSTSPPPAYSASSSKPTTYEAASQESQTLANEFITLHSHQLPIMAQPNTQPRLRRPIILPQRRPQTRSRGFIRAYAPDLQANGIDQATFLGFLEEFDKSMQASPFITVANLAGQLGIGQFYMSDPVSIAVSTAIQVAADVATEMHERKSGMNSFLDRIKDEIFRPRGLFCLVMTWDPSSPSAITSTKMTSIISSSLKDTDTSDAKRSAPNRLVHDFRSSSGRALGDLGTIETAPLIYPKLEEIKKAKAEIVSKEKGELKALMAKCAIENTFLDDYMDRRARADWAGLKPSSLLSTSSGPQPQFRSRYADPNHPACSGNLLALLTGGHYTTDNFMISFGGTLSDSNSNSSSKSSHVTNDQAAEKAQSGDSSSKLQGDNNNLSPAAMDTARESRFDRMAGGSVGAVRRVLQKNVLYLMIVNMPEEEEMARVRGMRRG